MMIRFLTGIFLLLPVFLIAQKDTVKVKPVFVNVKFNDPNTISYDKQSIELQKNNSIDEFLSSYSNLPVKKYSPSGLATVSIRGMQTAHTRVLWNGVPITSSMSGQSDLSLIPIFITDKITIEKGISSMQSTNGALGGAILLQTCEQQENFKYYSQFNSLLNASSGVLYATNFKKINFTTGFFGAYGKNHFTFKNTALAESPVDTVSNADFNYYGAVFHISSIATNLKIAFSSLIQKNYSDFPPLMSYEGLSRTEYQNTLRNINVFNVSKNNFSSNFWLSLTKMNYFLADSTVQVPQNVLFIKNNSNNNELNIGNTSDYKIIFNKNFHIKISEKIIFSTVKSFDYAPLVSTGYEAHRLQSVSSIVINFYNIKNNNFKFILNEVYADSVFHTPGFLFSFYHKKKIFYKLNLGRNLHLPTLNDLYWQPGGNPDLKPEIAYSCDLSFIKNFTFKNTEISIQNTLFSSYVFNLILWKPTKFYYWQPVNIQTVFARGDEVSIKVKIDKKISHQLLLNYSFTRSTNQSKSNENDDSYGKQLIYIPVSMANAVYDVAWKNYKITTTINYTGKRTTNTSNPDFFPLPAYWTASLNFSAEIKNVSLFFQVKNIFNHQYQSVLYKALPGRVFEVGCKWNFEK